ncbi:MAG: hypothetical protein LLG04_00005 [Parachlamydia sp.]|nr:hypothetical protein [Parachlamydia sp.]
MKKAFPSFFILFIALLFAQIADAEEKYSDKQIEELSKRWFHYSDKNGKQTLTLLTGNNIKIAKDKWFRNGCGGKFGDSIVHLRNAGAATSIPGTSLILAFLNCGPSGETDAHSIVAFFDRKNADIPLCFSQYSLMSGPGYWYGSFRSLDVRKDDNGYFVVAKMSGADGGDSWTSFAFLHVATNCKVTLLNRLYSCMSFDISWDGIPHGRCKGKRMDYRFLNDYTVEVINNEIVCPGNSKKEYSDYIESVVKTTREKYDLKALYSQTSMRRL